MVDSSIRHPSGPSRAEFWLIIAIASCSQAGWGMYLATIAARWTAFGITVAPIFAFTFFMQAIFEIPTSLLADKWGRSWAVLFGNGLFFFAFAIYTYIDFRSLHLGHGLVSICVYCSE